MNSTPAEPQISPSQGQQADILIVDDVPDNIRFLSSFLLEQRYQVRKAINGQMALGAVGALTPDLILLDINLPDISGYEVCRQLKADPATASIPIIFLSAAHEAIDQVKAFQLGAADYITKPFHLEEVLSRIQTQLTIQSLQKELRNQNQQLKQALENLKIAQANLVQQEKMATLRKVVAGVAHEINNPLSFIVGNVKPAKEHIHHLLNLVTLYQQKCGDADPEIQAYLDTIDLGFIASDLTNIINSMANGADRIRSVVLALKIFTRLDESGSKKVNLQQSIDNVLTLLQHRLTHRSQGEEIQVTRAYEKLPLVTGYADQLNQVIFNLLCNAIDAIDEKLGCNPEAAIAPAIAIRGDVTARGTIALRIRDNGIGIPEASQPYIFEPFFTTKPAGHGIGLGLATSRRIVEELHGGSLTCDSSTPEGTEFVIELPQ